ncbi:unnamed protein product [Schistosoma curassoni]|uniref:Transposase n=1 Tax=Schistosoma curassoni TaxID=6186 RepID=A0A183K410_9TREM|nr:unnamed protein product [Schistosoma curassoni]
MFLGFLITVREYASGSSINLPKYRSVYAVANRKHQLDFRLCNGNVELKL